MRLIECDGLAFIPDVKAITKATKGIYKELDKDGFDKKDIIEYIHWVVEKSF